MDAYVGLGSSLGVREMELRRAVSRLERRGFPSLALSSVWETEPVDSPGSGWFLNMAARIPARGRTPLQLLDLLLEVECELGRVRTVPNGPRTIDLDLLLMGPIVFRHARLTLPHPAMWARRFVLEPLAEIAPDVRNPTSGRTVIEELGRLTDRNEARRLGPLLAVSPPSAAETGSGL